MPTSHCLDVPGARLYYEVQGDGPLLMLAGHPMGAKGFSSIACLLAKDFKVVTYDPRGFFRSSVDDPAQDASPELLAEDLSRVLRAAGDGPAYVFGSSGGAVAALALVAKHPGTLRAVVAHEPPLALLLPEASEAATALRAICSTYRQSGARAAWGEFAAFTNMDLSPAGDNATRSQPSPMSERFFLHGLLPIALYEPDLAALRAAPAHLVVAAGTTSKGEFAWRAARALADKAGTPLVQFPGGHTGFATNPEDFARALIRTLA